MIFCHYLEDDDDTEGTWKFQDVLQHAKVKKGDSKAKDYGGYKGSATKILVHWETGDKTWEPLQEMLKYDPITCAIYAQKNKLLNEPGWKDCKQISKNEKKMPQMVHQVQLHSYLMAPKCKYGYEVPKNHKHAMKLGSKQNPNTKWVDSETLELS